MTRQRPVDRSIMIRFVAFLSSFGSWTEFASIAIWTTVTRSRI
jgi:hypothetical protein